MSMELSGLSRHIWHGKYRWRRGDSCLDATIEDTWRRVAAAVAMAEAADQRQHWQQAFAQLLSGFGFLPGGRILAGAGTGRANTLFNCFVMGPVEDSMDGIFEGLKEGALTLQQGGGVGYDFSTLRPRGAEATATGTIASGPVSFMGVWDSMCATLLSTGARRGAMMATLRVDHPDIFEFIRAKRGDRLRHFNLSVLVSDRFMEAVRDDRPWDLVFPLCDGEEPPAGDIRQLSWYDASVPVSCRVYRRLPARELWQALVQNALDSAEPGVLFIDRVNAQNNLQGIEQIHATNPCGEVPLPAYGCCDLGSINLPLLVQDPFTERARLDSSRLLQIVTTAVRFMDNVIEVSGYPLERQQQVQAGRRRLGLGLTGLADCLLMLGLRYDSAAGRRQAAGIMRAVCHQAYRTSTALAAEKGSFALFDRDSYLRAPFVAALPEDIRTAIARDGIRNSHLLSLAPAGTISLLAGNVSSGIEPIHASRMSRQLLNTEGQTEEFVIEDYACALWQQRNPGQAWPQAFVTSTDIAPLDHVLMQAELQKYVDNAISKTVNLPRQVSFATVSELLQQGWQLGLKGCTVFRPGTVRGEVIRADEEGEGCCGIEHLLSRPQTG